MKIKQIRDDLESILNSLNKGELISLKREISAFKKAHKI